MKKKIPAKSLPDIHTQTSIWGMMRMYLSGLRILHKGLGVPRIIAAYVFFTFAIISILFTVRVPMSINFMPATTAAKMHSRVLTLSMMIINLGVYGMIMSWHKSTATLIAIRIVVIGILLYFDLFILVRIIYTLIREGTLF